MSKTLLSLGAALASLTGMSVTGAEAKLAIGIDGMSSTAEDLTSKRLESNAHFQAGEDLLGFVMTKHADGTIVAQHGSHASHASHTSHASSR